MEMNLISLRQGHEPAKDLPDLTAYLLPLVGEPFRFARISYGGELTLHFGDLRPARSPKLKGKPYGAYVLGVRGSSWILKPGLESVVITAGAVFELPPTSSRKPLSKEELEAGQFIHVGSRVIAEAPFVVTSVSGFGLELRMSDGSSLLIVPEMPDENSEGENLPVLADWELSTPQGLLNAGPNLEWSFTPKAEKTAG